jgi:hypothetical protein
LKLHALLRGTVAGTPPSGAGWRKSKFENFLTNLDKTAVAELSLFLTRSC